MRPTIDELMLDVTPIIQTMAADFAKRGMVSDVKAITIDDLTQVGYEAALIAARSYDAGKGAAFATYAHHQIWRRMIAEIHNLGDTIPMPEYIHWYVIRHLAATEDRLFQELAREPTLEELQSDEDLLDKLRGYRDTEHADHQALIQEAVIYMREGNSVSLDDTDIDVWDWADANDPEIQTDSVLLQESMSAVLDVLPDLERKVMRLRFGFDEAALTLQEVGRRLNVTGEGVRKIEKRAMQTLRNDPRSRVMLRNWK